MYIEVGLLLVLCYYVFFKRILGVEDVMVDF